MSDFPHDPRADRHRRRRRPRSRSTTPTSATRSPRRWSPRSSPRWTAFEADESVGAIVVTGTPPAFCAGANLGNLAEADRRQPGHDLRRLPAHRPQPAADARRRQRRRRRCRDEPGARLRRADRRPTGPSSTPASCNRHPPRWRPHVDAAAHRRPAGGDGRGRVRSGARRRRGRTHRAGLQCVPTDSLLEVAHEFAAVAASAPRELAIEHEADDPGMADIDNHPDAVAARARPAALEHAAAVVRRAARRGASSASPRSELEGARHRRVRDRAETLQKYLAAVNGGRLRSEHGESNRIHSGHRVTEARSHKVGGSQMSQRHRTAEVPLPPKQELRAHAHGERHRIHVELQGVTHEVCSGLDPADVHEPGAAWKPMHHHDSEIAQEQARQARAARSGTGRPRCGSDAPSCVASGPSRCASPAIAPASPPDRVWPGADARPRARPITAVHLSRRHWTASTQAPISSSRRSVHSSTVMP